MGKLSQANMIDVRAKASDFPEYNMNANVVLGDTSGCSLGSVDIKAKIPFQYRESIQKRNLDFDFNKTLRTT